MNKPASADLSEVSPISCAPACDQTAEDAAFYRDVLHELIEFGMELVREVMTPGEGGLAAPEKAAVFNQISRTVRRTVRLAQFLGEKARAAIDTCRAAGRSDKWAGGAADVPGGDPRRRRRKRVEGGRFVWWVMRAALNCHAAKRRLAMTGEAEVTAMARLLGSAGVLFARDVQAAAAHYRDAMGFSFNRFWGEPASFVILRRDGMQFFLKQAEAAHVIPRTVVSPGLWDLYFYVDDVDALHREFVGRGARIDYGPCDQAYGCREFGTQDIDGHDVGFGQDLGLAG